ncbi:MAG: hypothetical protein ACO1N8_05000 [Methylophilus sp.]
MSAWDSIFSMENFHSYAWGCVMLYETLVDLEKKGFTTLVNPSRGAVPFINTLTTTHQFHCLKSKHSNRVLHDLEKPFSGNVIMLPFTSDPPNEWPEVGGLNSSEQIRDYWVKVLKAMLTGDLESQHLLYYQFVLTNLLGFEAGIGASIYKPTSKFVFVDTVISGRAICESERSFISNKLDGYHLVLLLENNGEDLEEANRKHIEELERNGKATLIRIKSLFTEDRGPALTGTWCVSVPQLVSLGSSFIDKENTNALIGAAVSFTRASFDPQLSNMGITFSNGILSTLLFSLISNELLQDTPKVSESFRCEFINHFTKNAHQFNPLDPASTEYIASNSIKNNQPLALDRSPIKGVEAIEVSSSHVIRLKFNEAKINKFLVDYKNHLRNKSLAYWYHHYNQGHSRII